ncbi:MAG: hypothetical protein R2795_18185 [Saprospiraceae bacterium]
MAAFIHFFTGNSRCFPHAHYAGYIQRVPERICCSWPPPPPSCCAMTFTRGFLWLIYSAPTPLGRSTSYEQNKPISEHLPHVDASIFPHRLSSIREESTPLREHISPMEAMG